MTYQRILRTTDPDIPYLTSILKLPQIARFISIDEKHYWNYVTHTENVFYWKAYDHRELVGAVHCEISDRILHLAIMVIPQHQRMGIATEMVTDIQSGKLSLEFDHIIVSIDEANVVSIALFEKMNFQFLSKEDELVSYVWK